MGDSLKFILEMQDNFSRPVGQASHSLDALQEKMSSTEETLGGGGVGLIGALIKTEAAIVGLGVAAVAAGAGLAIHASEAKQDTLDMLDAMLGSQEAAVDTYGAIEDLGGSIALSLDRGSELARELSAAGVTNKEQLIDAIKTIGEVESVLGKGAGGKIQNIIEKASASGQFKLSQRQLAGTGIDEGLLAQKLGVTKKQLESGQVNAARGIAALTSMLDEKFGKVAEKQALDIGNQFTRLKDNISKLFEDVDTGPFLEAFSSIVKVFDQSTASGRALKFMVTEFFGGLFKLVAKVAPYVTTFLKGMVIIGLKAYIALKPLGKAIGGIGDQKSGVEKLSSFMSGLGDAIAFVIDVLVEWIDVGSEVLSWFYDVESAMFEWVSAAFDLGGEIIKGLIGGLDPDKFVDALKNVAQKGVNAFKSVFGIHSPSKVMAKMGGHLMGGLESGIAANDNGPKKAMSQVMGGGESSPMTASGAGPIAGGSTSVTIGPGAIVIQINGSNAQEISSQLKQVLPGELASMFETLGLSVGAA